MTTRHPETHASLVDSLRHARLIVQHLGGCACEPQRGMSSHDRCHDCVACAIQDAIAVVQAVQQWKRVVEGFQDGTQDLAQLDVRLEEAQKYLFATLLDRVS